MHVCHLCCPYMCCRGNPKVVDIPSTYISSMPVQPVSAPCIRGSFLIRFCLASDVLKTYTSSVEMGRVTSSILSTSTNSLLGEVKIILHALHCRPIIHFN